MPPACVRMRLPVAGFTSVRTSGAATQPIFPQDEPIGGEDSFRKGLGGRYNHGILGQNEGKGLRSGAAKSRWPFHRPAALRLRVWHLGDGRLAAMCLSNQGFP